DEKGQNPKHQQPFSGPHNPLLLKEWDEWEGHPIQSHVSTMLGGVFGSTPWLAVSVKFPKIETPLCLRCFTTSQPIPIAPIMAKSISMVAPEISAAERSSFSHLLIPRRTFIFLNPFSLFLKSA